MKKWIAVLLTLTLLGSVATAEVLTIDLSTATLADLKEAQQTITTRMDELTAAEAPAAAKAPAADATIVSLSGTGTAIVPDVTVAQIPARVTVTGTVSLTLTGGQYDYTYNTSKAATDCSDLTEAATYTAMVEGEGDWSVTITPLSEGGSIACEGEGSYVSDLLTIDGAHIVTFIAQVPDSGFMLSSLILQLSYLTEYGFYSGDTLTNDILSSGDSYSADLIVKPDGAASNFYWKLNVAPGVKWAITLKQ